MAKRILLIEDEPMHIEIYATALRQAGFEVETIDWGYKAIERIKEIREKKAQKPDLILVDLILPDISGLEVLEEMRKYEETKDIPSFILTNYTSREIKEYGLKELAAEEYIVKIENTPSQIVEIIKKRLEKK
jgi:CheY-like chemotaxis protein